MNLLLALFVDVLLKCGGNLALERSEPGAGSDGLFVLNFCFEYVIFLEFVGAGT